MAAIDTALPDDVNIVVDAGNTGAAAIHYLPVRRGGRFIVALGMGGMGYSFGAGIGVAFARGLAHRRYRWGRILLHARYSNCTPRSSTGCPVTFILFNNNAHAMCVTREKLLLPRAVQLQPVPSQPTRSRAGGNVPRPAVAGRIGLRCAVRCTGRRLRG